MLPASVQRESDRGKPIRLAAREESERPDRETLPPPEELKKKTPEKLLLLLFLLGLKPNVTEFGRRARNLYELQLGRVIESKGRPDKETWEAIDEQLTRTSQDVLSQQTKDTVRQYRKFRIKEVAEYFVWIAVMDKGTCKSCDDRHGKRKTMKQWEWYGEPGSPVLICQNRCRCVLQPDLVSGEIPPDVKKAVKEEAIATGTADITDIAGIGIAAVIAKAAAIAAVRDGDEE